MDPSLFILEFYMSNGDVSVTLRHLSTAGGKICWSEERTSDKRLEMLLKSDGIYAVEFDNSFSWILPKTIYYQLDHLVEWKPDQN